MKWLRSSRSGSYENKQGIKQHGSIVANEKNGTLIKEHPYASEMTSSLIANLPKKFAIPLSRYVRTRIKL